MPKRAMPLAAALAAAAAGALVPGCSGRDAGRGANLSLVEIGERSFEAAERLESSGDARGAGREYRKALWAFRYHEQLTGEQPPLMDEAEDGARRAAGARRYTPRGPEW